MSFARADARLKWGAVILGILIVGAILTVMAIFVDLTWSPPWWVHLVWIPVGLALTVGGLRTAKAWLIAQEFVHRAREGKIAP